MRKPYKWPQRPYKVTIPRSAQPKISIYGPFEIVKQTKALWSGNDEYKMECAEPFTVRYKTKMGKWVVKESKDESKS